MALIDGTFYIDWVLSKPVLAIIGVINAGMGIATAIGALSFAGVPFTDIVGVMPFLVVPVGTNNMFLMVATVRRTNRAFPAEIRVGECLSDAAISITFFAAWLSVIIKWESEGRHCIFLKSTVPDCYKDFSSIFHRIFWLGSRPHKNIDNLAVNKKESAVAYFFQNWYAPILMQPTVRFMSILWYFVYLTFGIYGCLQLREGLEPINLLVEDSYAVPHYKALEKYFWHYGPTVQVMKEN
uniref:SSD domain-containing protein n=1 Tax=Panagrolaimus superbus TaxID=310955 RepID=A0A914YY29_9BILA